MKRFERRLLPKLMAGLITFASAFWLNGLYVMADIPYKTFTLDGYGRVVETQSAYIPVKTINKVGEHSFRNASDMKITADGEIYIADTGGKRILVTDIDGNLLEIYGEGVLNEPTGIFVTDDKYLYVADKGAQKVIVMDRAGKVVNEYAKPDHPLYGKGVEFKPQKLVVDAKGIMYIICEGNTNGIVQISPAGGGTFLGYYGTNLTSVTFLDIFRRAILTEEQLAKLPKNLPKTPKNLFIDKKGLIYTVTQGGSEDNTGLRKLNVAGKNLIQAVYVDPLPSAVSVGNYENIYVVSEQGYVYEYNKDGSLLFIFGGKDSGRLRIGLFQKAVAVDVDKNDNVFVLDQEKNEIQVFKPTEFTNLVHEALYLYQSGKYNESMLPLQEVLRMNSLFDYANQAIGQAYLQEGNYSEAMRYFRMAKDTAGYSDAYWEVRNIWLQNNLVTILLVLVLIGALWKLVKSIREKYGLFSRAAAAAVSFKNRPLVSRLNYTWYFIRHPIDGCYGIKMENKASYLCANILLTLFIIVFLIDKYATGFIVKTIPDGRYKIFSDIGGIIAFFLLLTACSYLVCAINDGEATFRQLYAAYAYSLGPYLVIKILVVLLSNVITYNEIFLVEFSNFFLYLWISVLLFIAVKEINGYSVKETVKVILLTAFFALIVVLLIFIMYVLTTQVYDFIEAIIGEAVYRFEKS
ncbi:NHL repeat protein [Thermoclostridium stercorarium subsp. stercorarium DSM 8532]|uniref:NHL repeat protein n=2 Tax=Thermoclostridium stercorarium TaxID=1510 RepID=L7VJ67_THES1|nr:YIP1 family protein [Thermoclostridium stercorarium]AGC68115.1 NHL repeat protein [Thermoclostridium stercorarium subsp. stercorarium DSM 8532]AGI39141.1 Pgl [Thermoclostridium stercorarium subsp. stercorarium DSM 8532]ANX01030.1 hypothetical protein CSTERLE_05250 [Thermoclostridium stercorarium subsp. leptospartum DSM 9219]